MLDDEFLDKIVKYYNGEDLNVAIIENIVVHPPKSSGIPEKTSCL